MANEDLPTADPDRGSESGPDNVQIVHFVHPDFGSPEYWQLVQTSMERSLRAWTRFRGMVKGNMEPDHIGTDERKAEELMWLHGGVVLECLAALTHEAAPPKALADPRLADLLASFAEAVREALDGHPPRFFRKSKGNKRGEKELNALLFARAYEQLADPGLPPGRRLVPDDDARATVLQALDLDEDAYRMAKKVLDETPFVARYWHVGAFRVALADMDPEARLAYARGRLREVGEAFRWVRADREQGRSRRPSRPIDEAPESRSPKSPRRKRRKLLSPP
jgi:hypothetical protein